MSYRITGTVKKMICLFILLIDSDGGLVSQPLLLVCVFCLTTRAHSSRERLYVECIVKVSLMDAWDSIWMQPFITAFCHFMPF